MGTPFILPCPRLGPFSVYAFSRALPAHGVRAEDGQRDARNQNGGRVCAQQWQVNIDCYRVDGFRFAIVLAMVGAGVGELEIGNHQGPAVDALAAALI